VKASPLVAQVIATTAAAPRMSVVLFMALASLR